MTQKFTNKHFSSKAFSLIEISIVILIIGILIAGVTSWSKLIYKSRLSTARTFTKSSPVASIKNLTIWLDSTSEDAILSHEAEDGALVLKWTDINSQMVDKKIFVQTLGDNYKPSYKEDAINGLPAIIFNYSTSPSDSDYLERTNTGVEDFISRNQADAFIVAKNGNQIVNTFFYWSQPDFALTPFYNYYTIFDFGGGIEYSSRISYSLGGSSSKYLPKPLVFRFKKISSGPMSIEINGKSVITCSNWNSTITSTETSALRVGRFFTGTIGEIIIFNRALNKTIIPLTYGN